MDRQEAGQRIARARRRRGLSQAATSGHWRNQYTQSALQGRRANKFCARMTHAVLLDTGRNAERRQAWPREYRPSSSTTSTAAKPKAQSFSDWTERTTRLT